MDTQRLTLERLHALVSYDKITGVFVWLVKASRSTKIGAEAGSVRGDGYRVIRVDGVLYTAHRLAWFYAHGEWPENKIDHRNGERSDNRLENLRSASNELNSQNRARAQSNNRSGLLGVSKKRGKWTAEIISEGQKFRLGSFDTPEAAHRAYMQFKRLLHVGCEREIKNTH